MIVLALNALVTRLTSADATSGGSERGGAAADRELSGGSAVDPLMPPPVRRIAVDREPHVAAARGRPPTARRASGRRSASARLRAERPPVGSVRERMRIESVWLAYGENWVVRDVSLPVRQGEVLALIGASGSGKTTLLRSLNRLTEVTAGAARSGRITLDGAGDPRARGQRPAPARVDGLPAAQPVPDEHLRQRRLRARRAAPAARRRRRRRSAELEQAVNDALRRAGLYEEVGGDLDRSALRLSGGQQQRLCIARALAAQPGGAAARRALLGARPDLDGDDRGADRRACARASRS